MPALIALIVAALGRIFTTWGSFFVASKLLFTVALFVYLPAVIKQIIVWFFEAIFCVFNSVMGSVDLEPMSIQLAGLGAYLGACFQLPECMSIILTALSLRLILNFVPMVK